MTSKKETMFSRTAYHRIATGHADMAHIADRLGMKLSELALRLEGSVPFTIEEALDLIRESDDTLLLRWMMERLGCRKLEIHDDDHEEEASRFPIIH